jgi:hypothetical protein
VFLAVDALSLGGRIDGYFIVSALCIMYGLVWVSRTLPMIERLQDASVHLFSDSMPLSDLVSGNSGGGGANGSVVDVDGEKASPRPSRMGGGGKLERV